MSDDDNISLDTVPGPGLTEELRALHEKFHEERTDGMYVGRILWPLPSPEPPKRRTRRMLVGLANPFPVHGLKRSPTGNPTKERSSIQSARQTREETEREWERKRAVFHSTQEGSWQQKGRLDIPHSPHSQVIDQ